MFFLNDGQFGRHHEFFGKLRVYSSGLSVCYSADISGATLKNSAFCELFQGF